MHHRAARQTFHSSGLPWPRRGGDGSKNRKMAARMAVRCVLWHILPVSLPCLAVSCTSQIAESIISVCHGDPRPSTLGPRTPVLQSSNPPRPPSPPNVTTHFITSSVIRCASAKARLSCTWVALAAALIASKYFMRQASFNCQLK